MGLCQEKLKGWSLFLNGALALAPGLERTSGLEGNAGLKKQQQSASATLSIAIGSNGITKAELLMEKNREAAVNGLSTQAPDHINV